MENTVHDTTKQTRELLSSNFAAVIIMTCLMIMQFHA